MLSYPHRKLEWQGAWRALPWRDEPLFETVEHVPGHEIVAIGPKFGTNKQIVDGADVSRGRIDMECHILRGITLKSGRAIARVYAVSGDNRVEGAIALYGIFCELLAFLDRAGLLPREAP